MSATIGVITIYIPYNGHANVLDLIFITSTLKLNHMAIRIVSLSSYHHLHLQATRSSGKTMSTCNILRILLFLSAALVGFIIVINQNIYVSLSLLSFDHF